MRPHAQNRIYETEIVRGAPLNLRIIGETAAKRILKGEMKNDRT